MKRFGMSGMAMLIVAANGALADLASLSNSVQQCVEESTEPTCQAVERNKLRAINESLARELGRSLGEARDEADLRQAHAALVKAYLAEIRQHSASADTTWPAGRDAAVWKKSAEQMLKQAETFHAEALTQGTDLSPSLRIMARVRAWTRGKADVSLDEDWPASIEKRAEDVTSAQLAAGLGRPTPDPPAQPGPGAGVPTRGAGAPSEPEPAVSSSVSPVPGTASAASSNPSAQPGSRPGLGPSAQPSSPGSPAPAVTLIVVGPVRKNTLAVRHSFEGENKAAWIGFYKSDADNKHYLSYTFLNNLTDRLYDVPRPEEPGTYQFRIFADERFDPVAVSAPIEIRGD